VRDYLSPSTAEPLRNIVETNLISLHAETLVEVSYSATASDCGRVTFTM